MRKFLAIAISAVSFVSVAQVVSAQVAPAAPAVVVYEPNPTLVGDLTSDTTTGIITNSALGDGTIAEVHLGSLIDGTVTGNNSTTVITTQITNSADGVGTEASVTYGSIGETP